MHAKNVTLHGGPYHGKVIAVPADNDHFHIVGQWPAAYDGVGEPAIDTREGTYSQVSGPNHQHDFEWDGWVSH